MTHSANFEIGLFDEGLENPEFLKSQLITYLGNKRSLLPSIEEIVWKIRGKLGDRKLRSVDLFSGSGVVARLLKAHSSLVIANDLETYSRIINECFLTNSDSIPEEINQIVNSYNTRADSGEYEDGFIRKMYAPLDELDIQPHERVFYTIDNARRLDTFAQWISKEEPELRPFLLAPLMSKASVHTNTAGMFKGFYKNPDTKAGAYGGKGENALQRILGQIRMESPVSSWSDSEKLVFQEDATTLGSKLPETDLVYVDPPYNQHPYGSNYFMLNYLHDYQVPSEISQVSGIPTNWNRSSFNIRSQALRSLKNTLEPLNTRFLLISFNDEGFISPDEMREMLTGLGNLDEVAIEYNTFRGSRNLRDRSEKVTEHLYLVERT